MRIDPRRLVVLRAVAAAGGVLAAAPALRMSPSAVSQQLARLEAETGTVLLDRSQLGGRRSARLTPAGELLARHAYRLTDVLDEAERDLASLLGAVGGTVTVGAFPTAIAGLLAPAVAALRESAPQLVVEVRQTEVQPGLPALRSRELDLLVAEGPVGRGFVRRRLLDDPYLVAYPAAWGTLDLAALAERPWVTGPAGSDARRALDRLGVAAGRRVHECLEYPAVLALVGAGVAAAVVPGLALGRPAGVHTVPASARRRIELVARAGLGRSGQLVADAIAGVAAAL